MPPDIPTNEFEADNDSLYVMPLALIPFETPGLARGRLRMNGALVHVMDVFNDGKGRRGYILLEDINQKFGQQNYGWKASDQPHPDLALLEKLHNLSSFDVYSLRILFRKLGIRSPNPDALQLSAQTTASLSAHLKRFTAPLILNVYGDVSALGNAADPVELFRNPDKESAVRNLRALADRLEIGIEGIPEFLERFSECYLSISYFERYLHEIYPEQTTVIGELEQLTASHYLQDQIIMRTNCERACATLSELMSSALGKIERFHLETNTMWQSLTAERFYEISEMVNSYQISVAGVLCGLGIKMTEWRKRFETPDTGSPAARVEMLMSSLLPGLDKLKLLDQRMETDDALQRETQPAKRNKRPTRQETRHETVEI